MDSPCRTNVQQSEQGLRIIPEAAHTIEVTMTGKIPELPQELLGSSQVSRII